MEYKQRRIELYQHIKSKVSREASERLDGKKLEGWTNEKFSSSTATEQFYTTSYRNDLIPNKNAAKSLKEFVIFYLCDLVNGKFASNYTDEYKTACKTSDNEDMRWFKSQQKSGDFLIVDGETKFVTKGGRTVYVDESDENQTYEYFAPDADGILKYYRTDNRTKEKFVGQYELGQKSTVDNDGLDENRIVEFLVKKLKKMILEQTPKKETEKPLSGGAQSQEETQAINKKTIAKYFTTNVKWSDPDGELKTLVDQSVVLLKTGNYTGDYFRFLRNVLNRYHKVKKLQQYKDYADDIDDASNNGTYLQNPSPEDTNYVRVDDLRDLNLYLKKPFQIYKKVTPREYSRKECISVFDTYYDDFEKGFAKKGGPNYCTSPQGVSDRRFIAGCRNSGRFGLLRNPRMEQLEKGVVKNYNFPNCKISYQ